MRTNLGQLGGTLLVKQGFSFPPDRSRRGGAAGNLAEELLGGGPIEAQHELRHLHLDGGIERSVFG